MYIRAYTRSLSLSLSFRRSRFALPFYHSRSLSLAPSLPLSLLDLSTPPLPVSGINAQRVHTRLSFYPSLSLSLSPLAGLVLYTTIVRPLIWFPHSIFVSLGSIVSFAPSEACRPHPNPLCISPLLCAATSSSSPLPLFDSLSAGLSFTLQRASLSLPTPPTPDTRHPIPNYVKRFRILRPDYAASLPSRDSSLSLSLSRTHSASLFPLSSRSLAHAPVRHLYIRPAPSLPLTPASKKDL